jgi:hypothetical protein
VKRLEVEYLADHAHLTIEAEVQGKPLISQLWVPAGAVVATMHEWPEGEPKVVLANVLPPHNGRFGEEPS